ncbi:MAG: thiamine pyrophosphate-binding protein, partial [Pseudomonadota bacterium]
AHLAYSPLVVIAGAISRRDLGKDTFQEVDQVALFAPICKRSILVTEADRLAEMLRDAMRLALSGRRGPVVLHVPRDVFAAEVAPPAPGPITLAQGGPPSPDDITAILDMLDRAKSPVIVAGGGLKWSGGTAVLQNLAKKLEVPVVASTGHGDVMPHGHPLFAGQGGPRGNRVASRLTREADFLLVLGARLAFNSTFLSHDYISATAKIVQVDVEGSAVGRYFPVALGLQADATQSAKALVSAAASRPIAKENWAGWLRSFQADWADLMAERAAEAADESAPMQPRRALAEIRKALPHDAIVTLDTGNACLQAADRLAHHQAPGLVTPLDFGLVGFGYAAALGAQAAAPDRSVVSVMGDGGFGFTMAEITTAVRYKLPVVAVVLDNGAWGAEKAYQEEFFGGRLLGAEIESPAYDKVSALCGAKGFAADTAEALGQALKDALASKEPAVIHVKIDPEALSTLRKDLFKPAKSS